MKERGRESEGNEEEEEEETECGGMGRRRRGEETLLSALEQFEESLPFGGLVNYPERVLLQEVMQGAKDVLVPEREEGLGCLLRQSEQEKNDRRK